MQHATQQLGVPFARPTVVSDVQYVYDIEHRSGLAIPSIHLIDLDGVSLFDDKPMGAASVCPMPTGACVSSVAGGSVEGWDMYGQFVQETLSAGATSKIAFAGVVVGPPDLEWESRYGLPYKWIAADASQDADIVMTPPAADGDARGTFIYQGTDKVVELRYYADREQPFGAPYATRFASSPRTARATFAGTINTGGVIAVTKTQIADGATYIFLTMPDGQTIKSLNAAGVVNYTLPPLWMSKYARTITDIDTLIRGSTENGTPIIVNLTGNVAAPVIAPAPPPDPPPAPAPFPALPATFTTHAQADAWLDEFTLALGVGEPLDWATQTLAQKHASAQALIDALDAPT